MARVVELLIAESPSALMRSLASVRAVASRGLEGDRYFHGVGTFSPQAQRPDYEVTLIEKEHVDAFAQRTGLAFTTSHARRNIVTEGVDLNALVGVEFYVGTVLLRGVRLCEPCNYLAKATFPEVLRGFVHKGGLRAQIVTSGVISLGDAIAKKEPEPAIALDDPR
jgi:hypothetical protein